MPSGPRALSAVVSRGEAGDWTPLAPRASDTARGVLRARATATTGPGPMTYNQNDIRTAWRTTSKTSLSLTSVTSWTDLAYRVDGPSQMGVR